MKRKGLCLLLTAIMVMGIAACGPKDDEWGGAKGGINVVIDEAGFGSAWLDNAAAAYSKKTGIKVNVDKNYIQGETISLLNDGTLPYDIAFPMGNILGAQNTNRLVDLTPLYERTPEGSEIPVKEMLTPSLYEKMLTEDGKIFQVPWTESYMSIVYNKSSLDKAFPDGYTLPRTTQELLDFCEKIKKETQLYPFSFCPSIPYSYCAHLVWWAQYEGFDDYYDYFYGYYRDANGERKLALNGEVMDMPGRKKSLEELQKLIARNNGNMHANADSMTYTDMQVAFLGQGYKGRDMKECAFAFNGNWLENEMKKYLAVKPQDFRMMKMPVISCITEKLEDKQMSETKLREVISAIDNGETDYQKLGVSENDFARIREARRMVNGQTMYSYPACVPKTSKNQDKAIDFLEFLVSAEGQKIYAESTNGLTMPFGYQPDAETVSSFVQSGYDLFGRDYLTIEADGFSPLVYNQGFSYYVGLVDSKLYSGSSPDSILKTTKDYYMTYWDQIIALA